MSSQPPAIEIQDLVHRYGPLDAVNGLSLTVPRGRCYGFFGRNGAGKTTTIKCLLNLLRPKSGTVRVFGIDPGRDEVEVKKRLSYVPDALGFYPWMTIRGHLDYLASFRELWNDKLEKDLLERFGLDAKRRANSLSKGEKTQVALIGALCPEPELLVLDEPTSGLDPLVRHEFIRTVIGSYQDTDPGNRTIFISTHLISEFEGLIDEFTVIDHGKAVLSMQTDAARERFHKLRIRFRDEAPPIPLPGAIEARRTGREIEVIVNGGADQLLATVQPFQPESCERGSLSLEEIFLASMKLEGRAA